MSIGDVCKIRRVTRNGERQCIGILMGRHKEQSLWLLIMAVYDDSYNIARSFTVRGKHYDKDFGYTKICAGNLVVDYGNEIINRVGIIDAHDLDRIRIDVFESDRCGLLQSFDNGTDKPDDFFSNYTKPSGQTVLGGFMHKL